MSNKKILIVDDDPNIHDIYEEFLTFGGFSVDSAFDGEEGLLKITKEAYDLVLLDIIMPKIDGFGVLRQLKIDGNNNPSRSLIIIFSSIDQPNVIKEAIGLGATGFLDKSALTPDQAMIKINEFLDKSSQLN